MGNGSANCGRLLGLARVSALLACVTLFAPAAAESKARDRDHDGLSDRYELKKSHTKIRKADSDRDRLKDGYEVRKSHTSPRRADTDRDGLSDYFELRRSRTNPRKRDTDKDGTNDGAELLLGRNPKKPDKPSALNTAPVPPFTLPDLPDPLPDLPDLLPPETTITTGPTGTVANGTASFSFASSEANSTFECRLDGSAWTECDSPQPYAGLADGVHTFSVRATDESGNTDLTPAQRRWTVAIEVGDTTPPDTSITAGPSGTVTDHSASFAFASTESGSTFDCRLDGGAWTDCSSPKAYSNLADGLHTFGVRATDSVGNTDASPASRTWTVTTADTTAPSTTISSGPSGTANTASASFAFASSETGSTFQCRIDAGAWGACTSPKAYSGLADGSHTFDVRATDAAGNTDATPASRTWTVDTTPVDTTAPDTSISSGPSGTVTTSSASFAFASTESGSTFQCRIDSGSWGACTSPKSYSALANGSHTFDVRATDGAGNTDASPASRAVAGKETSTGGNNCMPDPSSCGCPDVENTGVVPGVARTTVNGDVTLSTAGQVYENKTVNGTISITAPNVTVRNVKVIMPKNGFYGIQAY